MKMFGIMVGLFFFSSTAEAIVNINTADVSSLQEFNGVGPSTAQKIVDFRTTNGDFASCDDLVNVKGIGPATLQKIKPDCIVSDGTEPPKSTEVSVPSVGTGHIDINTADSSTLQEFNGVGPSTAQKIIDFRETNGNFNSCDELVKINGIGAKTMEKIKPDCTVKVEE